VDVEGAPCGTPGTDTDCPPGQACGVDGKCSERATQCMAAELRCVPDTDKRCSDDGMRIETCTKSDPCGAWELEGAGDDCSAVSLECDDSSGTARCACGMPAGEIVVDVAAAAGTLTPTGASEPEECRFRTLRAALDYARFTWQPTHGGAAATVRALGSPAAGAPVVFASESFPLPVGPGVTLTTAAATPRPEDWVVSPGPGGTDAAVELHGGGTLEGFTLGAGAGSGDGIVVACDGGRTNAAARQVVVAGGHAFRRGVVVEETCGLEASDLDVRDSVEAGLWVNAALADPAAPDVGVTVRGGTLSGNGGAGAELRSGFLEIGGRVVDAVPFTVSGNQGFGIVAQARPAAPFPAVRLAVDLADLTGNGEAGLLVSGANLPATSTASVRRTKIHANLGRTSLSAHTGGRRAAGAILRNAPVQLEFQGNAVYGNGSTIAGVYHDQVAVFSTARWVLSGADCDAGANRFACPAPGGYLVYSSAVQEADYALAGNAYWPVEPAGIWPPDSLVFHTSYIPICGPADPAPLPTCP